MRSGQINTRVLSTLAQSWYRQQEESCWRQRTFYGVKFNHGSYSDKWISAEQPSCCGNLSRPLLLHETRSKQHNSPGVRPNHHPPLHSREYPEDDKQREVVGDGITTGNVCSFVLKLDNNVPRRCVHAHTPAHHTATTGEISLKGNKRVPSSETREAFLKAPTTISLWIMRKVQQ